MNDTQTNSAAEQQGATMPMTSAASLIIYGVHSDKVRKAIICKATAYAKFGKRSKVNAHHIRAAVKQLIADRQISANIL